VSQEVTPPYAENGRISQEGTGDHNTTVTEGYQTEEYGCDDRLNWKIGRITKKGKRGEDGVAHSISNRFYFHRVDDCLPQLQVCIIHRGAGLEGYLNHPVVDNGMNNVDLFDP
jgi:hypothetical protein